MEINVECLEIEIETTRKNLIVTGISQRLSSPETIQISQVLDQLINQFMEITQKASLYTNKLRSC